MHEPRKLAFIDALRGFAILLVILVHATQTVSPATPAFAALAAGGARGVQLFYIASALTLCLSWDARSTRERSPLRNFYLRRWFRIAPMFYIAIAFYVLLDGLAPRTYAPNGIEWYYIPLTALFLNGFHPETVTSVVPGGWSIAIEMTFYLVLPMLVTRFRTVPSLLVLLAMSLVLDRMTGFVFRQLYLPMYPPEQAYLVDNFTFLNFFGQFPVFAIGMLTYAVYRRDSWRKSAALFGGASFIAWFVISRWMTGADLGVMLSKHIAIAVAFAALALALAEWPLRVLVNRLTRLIGTLSFSMYLSHFAVIAAFEALGFAAAFGRGDGAAILHYVAVVVATVAISWPCYRFIERPGIEAGRRSITMLEGAAAAAPAQSTSI